MTIKITPEAVKERIAALESAGELSLKEQRYLDIMRWAIERPAQVVPDVMVPTIEAIKRILPTSNPDEYAACIGADMWNACRAAMLQAGNSPVIPDSCTWHCEEDINNWHSDCGYQFQFMEEGPEENGVKFCPKCGKSVAISATE